MLVIFTDLDGTLLDPKTYSFEAAVPALDMLRARSVPLVFCTSKTRAETAAWRSALRNNHPFIVENGGALFVPEGYFPGTVRFPEHREGYAAAEFGSPYPELVETLRAAAAESGCAVRGFHDMSVEEISARCGIPPEQAALARQREYDEPFEILGSGGERLLEAIVNRGKRWTRGGRFHHILGANDKAHCVSLLTRCYRQAGGAVTAAGLGDGLNDLAFLEAVDIPVVIESPASATLLSMIPRARLAGPAGPPGWNRAVLEILREPFRSGIHQGRHPFS